MEIVNPFTYGGVVGPDAFCNREQEQVDPARAAHNGDRLFVYAERRMGKTSLVQRVVDRLDLARFLPVYIDLWPTDGTDGFVDVTAKALAEAAATRTRNSLKPRKPCSVGFSPRSRSTTPEIRRSSSENRLPKIRLLPLMKCLRHHSSWRGK